MNARTIAPVDVPPPSTSGAKPVTTSRYTILDRQKPTLRHVLARWETLLALLLLAVFVIGGVSLEHFLDPYNLLDGTVNFSEKALIAELAAMNAAFPLGMAAGAK